MIRATLFWLTRDEDKTLQIDEACTSMMAFRKFEAGVAFVLKQFCIIKHEFRVTKKQMMLFFDEVQCFMTSKTLSLNNKRNKQFNL